MSIHHHHRLVLVSHELCRFGYCGKGEGFCTPSSRSNLRLNTSARQRKSNQTKTSKSGAGCVLENVEWVGGDLPPIVGGGGVRLDKNTSDECFNRFVICQNSLSMDVF